MRLDLCTGSARWARSRIIRPSTKIVMCLRSADWSSRTYPRACGLAAKTLSSTSRTVHPGASASGQATWRWTLGVNTTLAIAGIPFGQATASGRLIPQHVAHRTNGRVDSRQAGRKKGSQCRRSPPAWQRAERCAKGHGVSHVRLRQLFVEISEEDAMSDWKLLWEGAWPSATQRAQGDRV